MAQVSKNKLSPKVEKQIFFLFHQVLADLKKPEEVAEFLDDLLTQTEKTMLAKRLAIAILLVKDYKFREISDILKVSISTIASVSNWLKYKGQGYKKVIEKLIKEEKRGKIKEEVVDFWEDITHIPTFDEAIRGRYEKKRKDRMKLEFGKIE